MLTNLGTKYHGKSSVSDDKNINNRSTLTNKSTNKKPPSRAMSLFYHVLRFSSDGKFKISRSYQNVPWLESFVVYAFGHNRNYLVA
jgi:hypothetical protein